MLWAILIVNIIGFLLLGYRQQNIGNALTRIQKNQHELAKGIGATNRTLQNR